MMNLLEIIVSSIRILILDLELKLIDILLALLIRIHKEDSMAEFVRFEGKYKIFKSRTGEYIVKRAEDNYAVFITKSEYSAVDWCKRHG